VCCAGDGYVYLSGERGATFRCRDDQWERIPVDEEAVLGASEKPSNHSVSLEKYAWLESGNHRCFVTGSGPSYEESIGLYNFNKGFDKSDRDGRFIRAEVNKLKAIDGCMYACGGGRSFRKRVGKDKWHSYSHEIPIALMHADSEWYDLGFRDFDGFQENDIYAAGGSGDVWNYDGKSWRQLPFPGNIQIETVCCGQDGLDYISGEEGVTFVGKEDTWEKIDGPYLN